MLKLVKPLRSGQITIPVDFRRKLKIDGDSLLEVTLDKGELRMRPVRITRTVAGSPWLKDLYGYFALVRQEAQKTGLSEQKINTSIEEAVKAVRSKHAQGGI